MIRYKVNWSKSGKGIHRQESEPLSTFAAAMALAQEKRPHNRTVTITRENSEINPGQFFLDFIVK